MARQGSTGQIRLWYVPTISNKAAPTTSEINAGTDLTPQLVRDGLNTPASGQTMDAADASDAYNTTAPGTYGGDPITATFHRNDTGGSDTAWSTLTRTTAGYFVVRRFGGSSTAIASSQKVEVWPITVISREMAPIADNQTQRFTATSAVTSPPNDNATVA